MGFFIIIYRIFQVTIIQQIVNVKCWTDCVLVKCVAVAEVRVAFLKLVHSCFSSYRITLSPFTKDFCEEEHNEYKKILVAIKLGSCGLLDRALDL